jgi:signal transduction histidine kinase
MIYIFFLLTRNSRKIRYINKFQSLVTKISTDFIQQNSENIDNSINLTLKLIGEFFNADRSYIFLLSDYQKDEIQHEGQIVLNNSHEWCAEGVSPQIENLQGLPQEMIPWWMNKVHNNIPIYIPVVEKMPEEAKAEKDILEAQNIISLIVIPLIIEKKAIGCIGFDFTKKTIKLSDNILKTLRIAGEIISNALERKRMEIFLKEARDEALKSSKMKTEFLSKMSHELKTPMVSITGMLEILKDSNINSEQKEYVEEAYKSSEHLLKLINDILDYSKLESNKLKLENEKFNIFDEIKKIHDYFIPLVQSEKIELLIKTDENIPKFLIGDIKRISQVLYNLLGNALKFTEKGHVKMETNLLNLDSNEASLEIKVSDTGIGIKKEFLPHLFKGFNQEDGSLTRKHSGAGLGLSLSENIIKNMGGELNVESEFGKGTIFTINLKLKISNICEEKNFNVKEKIDELHIELEDMKILVEEFKKNTHISIEKLEKAINEKNTKDFLEIIDSLKSSIGFLGDKETFDVLFEIKNNYNENNYESIQKNMLCLKQSIEFIITQYSKHFEVNNE